MKITVSRRVMEFLLAPCALSAAPDRWLGVYE